jgi:hypothetical protein
VADLTVKAREKKDGMKLELALDELNEGRKVVLDLGKGWASTIKNAPTAREAEAWLVEAEKEVRRSDERSESRKALWAGPGAKRRAKVVGYVG